MKDTRHERIIATAQDVLADPSLSSARKVSKLLALSAHGCKADLTEQLRLMRDTIEVAAGPFKGMAFPRYPNDMAYAARFLGAYETALHSTFTAWRTLAFDRVVNIGAAQGYYAVGLALLFPQAEVLAYEQDAIARSQCAQTAQANNVSSRIQVRGEFTADLTRSVITPGSLVLCDVEGAEYDLFAPSIDAPRWSAAHLIIELHGIRNDASRAETLMRTFAPSHHITLVQPLLPDMGALPDLRGFTELERYLLLWEGRIEETPWAVLTPR